MSARPGTWSLLLKKGRHVQDDRQDARCRWRVDTHADTHEAAVLDGRGRLLAVKKFLTTDQGIREMLTWMRGFGRVAQVGVEGTGSYGAELTRQLRSAGIKVVEVNQPHAHTRSRRGKTDAIDAEAAARKVLAGECAAIPKDTTGIVEAVRQLHVARAGAVQARTAALNQLDDLLVTAPAELRQKLTAKTLQGKASQCAQWQPDPERIAEPVQAAQSALRSIARRIGLLSDEIRLLERQLSSLVKRVAPEPSNSSASAQCTPPSCLSPPGENIERLSSETAFAHMCAAAPVPASSGKTERHRLNHGGNRAANRSLYMIGVVRLRYCARTRDYSARRTAEGKSKQEIIRCLKRYIAREVYYTLRADLKALAPAA